MAGRNETLSILLRAVGANQAAKDVGRVDTALGRLTSRAGQGLRTAAGNLAKIGAVAAGVIGTQVYAGIQSLESLENATTAVDGAIRQMGQSGKVTSAEVATWANQIEASIGAAFDDKDITRATAILIRFGKVTPANLKQAMTVMTDLAAKTGDVDSASTLLAKALADPEKAAGKLARAGVVLTKAEQDQIKAFMKAGQTAKAQKVLLDALAKTTTGAAAATQGPYKRAMSTLRDVTEDAQRALAEGFLPIIERIATVLSNKLAQPGTINSIREFGKGLAGSFDRVLDAATKIPWGSIADAMKLAGTGAKAVLDFFVGLPPWVQTAVLTGWGLNKLTGGALGGIVGELGKGLIKGVLGMNAGVVNIRAGVVNGGGVGAAAGKGGGIGGIITKVFLVGAAAAVIAELASLRGEQSTQNKAAEQGLLAKTYNFAGSSTPGEIGKSLVAIQDYTQKLAYSLTPEGLAYQLNIDGVRDRLDEVMEILRARLGQANQTLDAIEAKRETNRINVTLKNIATTVVRISAREVNRAQTTFRVYSAGSGGLYAS
jgi:hypothetical protein